MEIIPYTTKFGAQAMFISNLACWSPTCRQNYNTLWLERGGQLNPKEHDGLVSIGPIFFKYNNRNKKNKMGYLDTVLLLNLPESRIWELAAKLVNAPEYNKLKTVFGTLAPRFEKIWINSLKQNTASLKILERIVRDWPTQGLSNALRSFWGTSGGKKPVSLFYFTTPLANHTNGKTLSPNLIVLERNVISNNANEISKVRAIILHEIIHARYEQRLFSRKLIGFLNGHNLDISFELGGHTHRMKNILREAAVNALVPNGYLGEKYLGLNIKKRYEQFHKTPLIYTTWERLMISVSEKVNTITKQYISNGRKIDNDYLNHLYNAITVFEAREVDKK